MPRTETASYKTSAGGRDTNVQSNRHRKFFIGGLPSNVTAALLRHHFEQVCPNHDISAQAVRSSETLVTLRFDAHNPEILLALFERKCYSFCIVSIIDESKSAGFTDGSA
jgi:hypothetical protein